MCAHSMVMVRASLSARMRISSRVISFEHVRIGEGYEAQLVQCVRGIADQLAEEHLPVAVQAVHDEVHQPIHLHRYGHWANKRHCPHIAARTGLAPCMRYCRHASWSTWEVTSDTPRVIVACMSPGAPPFTVCHTGLAGNTLSECSTGVVKAGTHLCLVGKGLLLDLGCSCSAHMQLHAALLLSRMTAPEAALLLG